MIKDNKAWIVYAYMKKLGTNEKPETIEAYKFKMLCFQKEFGVKFMYLDENKVATEN